MYHATNNLLAHIWVCEYWRSQAVLSCRFTWCSTQSEPFLYQLVLTRLYVWKLRMVLLTLSVPSFSFHKSMSCFLGFSLTLLCSMMSSRLFTQMMSWQLITFRCVKDDFFPPLHLVESCLEQPNNLRMNSVSLWLQTVSAVCDGPTSWSQVTVWNTCLAWAYHLVVTVRLSGNLPFNATDKQIARKISPN